jgi:hypothetical protein
MEVIEGMLKNWKTSLKFGKFYQFWHDSSDAGVLAVCLTVDGHISDCMKLWQNMLYMCLMQNNLYINESFSLSEPNDTFLEVPRTDNFTVYVGKHRTSIEIKE